MPLAPLPFQVLAEIAFAIVDAPDLQSAFDLLASELSALFDTDAMVFEKRAHQWLAVAGAEDASQERELQEQLAGVLAREPGLFSHLTDPDGAPLTAISLSAPEGPELALVLDGDWTADRSTLKVFALLVSMGLDSLRHRQDRHAAAHRLRAGYAMARRWSRVASVESVAQQIVDHIAELVEADRVSLSLYDKSQDALFVASTHGYDRSAVADSRIAPGAWVIGHVYSRAHPIFVSDTRVVPGSHPARYRTHSFAVVPLIAGNETIGVLAVTEKRNHEAFSRDDETALRAMSVIASLAIVAARGKADAAKLAYAATVDSVTHLLNRPYFDSRLHEEVERTRREGSTLAVLIGDIDDFKRVNDSYGHQVGDQVLAVVAGIIRSAVRVFDVCARYGGDEFAILMPNCDRASAVACAERIRVRIAQYEGGEDGSTLPPLTMSIGAAVIQKDEDGPTLISRADRHLYQAKAGGKNVVRVDSPEDQRRATAPQVADSKLNGGGTNGRFEVSRPGTNTPVQDKSAYVLVAGMSDARAALCVDIVNSFGVKGSIARSNGEALSLIEQLGPPAVLIIDLATQQLDGFGVIEYLPADATEIIAWSTSRDATEYARSRLVGQKARVLSSMAPATTLRSTIAKALHAQVDESAPRSAATPTDHDGDTIMRALADKTRRLSDAPGVAVYLKAPGDIAFRTLVSWASEDSITHLPHALPRAFNSVVETGRAVMLPDIRDMARGGDVPEEAAEESTAGLVAVPIMFASQVVGAICIFDIQPLVLADCDLATLSAIGREAFAPAAPAAPAPPATSAAAALGGGSSSPFHNRAVDRRAPDVPGTTVPPARIDWPSAILERTGGEFAVAREIARARREGRQLSVVLFDVGPAPAEGSAELQSPDERLEAISDTLLRAIRQSDLPIRWSVNELLVVLPGLKGSEARTVAERVRAALQAGSGHRLNVSGGVAEFEEKERFADVVERARQKVAMAVGRGHNRVL
jgi:diguanylate cyclase (GGDEF)-like protein